MDTYAVIIVAIHADLARFLMLNPEKEQRYIIWAVFYYILADILNTNTPEVHIKLRHMTAQIIFVFLPRFTIMDYLTYGSYSKSDPTNA